MEKIISISEAFFKPDVKSYQPYEGWEIHTSKQVIRIGISSGQSCCEQFGCIITNDDTNDFIGATIRNVSITDTALNNKKIDELEYLDSGGAMFVNVETNKGLLQFAAYNNHNGYYGHTAVLISKQLTKSENL